MSSSHLQKQIKARATRPNFADPRVSLLLMGQELGLASFLSFYSFDFFNLKLFFIYIFNDFQVCSLLLCDFFRLFILF
jgi:hypothetical protein